MSFRREKFIPFGGPNGGDGGRGGSVFAMADRNINTLIDYRYARRHIAKNGEQGRGSDQFGAAAPDIESAHAGGHHHPQRRDRRADGRAARARPARAAGQGRRRRLRQPALQDAAPTAARARRRPAGRARPSSCSSNCACWPTSACWACPTPASRTLIAAISNARPKIADYPFTTLHPNLGVVRVGPERSFVVADIPGLIEGASEGAGLGHQFLRHLQRTRLLLHIVDAAPFDDADPVAQVRAIVAELKKYDPQAARQAALAGVQQDRHGAGGRTRAARQGLRAPAALEGAGVHDLGAGARRAAAAGRGHLDACGRVPARRAAARPALRRRGAASRMASVVAGARRIVVKVGSSLVTNEGRGVDAEAIGNWSRQLAALAATGREVVMVSSGAIAEGMKRLGWTTAAEGTARTAGRRRGGPDGTGADVRVAAGRARHGQRAGAAHARRPGRPRALPQCALDPAHAAGAEGHSRHQRERHRRQRRDQVRRQRHARARWWPTWSTPTPTSSSPTSAACTRPTRARTRRHASSPRPRPAIRRWKPWPAAPAAASAAAAC